MFIKLEGGADLEPASDATQGGCQYNSGFSRVKLSSYLVSAAGFEPTLVEPFIMADMPFRLYPPCTRKYSHVIIYLKRVKAQLKVLL